MVAINSRLKPRFHQLHPSPWLPESTIWRAALVAYGCLGAWHVVLGSTLLGLACLAVSAVVSPLLRRTGRATLSRALGRMPG